MDEGAFEFLMTRIADLEGRLSFMERLLPPVLAAMPPHAKSAAQANASLWVEHHAAIAPRGVAEAFSGSYRRMFDTDPT